MGTFHRPSTVKLSMLTLAFSLQVVFSVGIGLTVIVLLIWMYSFVQTAIGTWDTSTSLDEMYLSGGRIVPDFTPMYRNEAEVSEVDF